MALTGNKEFQRKIFYFNYPHGVPKNILVEINRKGVLTKMSKFIRCEILAKYLHQEGFLGQYDFTRLTSGAGLDKDPCNLLIELLMKAGEEERVVERLHYCLMKSYQDEGILSHKEYADQLRYTVANAMSLSPLIPRRSSERVIDEAKMCTEEIVTKLEGICVSTETAQEFVVNLGVVDVHNYSNFSDLNRICVTVMEQKEVIYPEEIIQAMVLTKGLGQFASSLAYPIYSVDCEMFLNVFGDNRYWRRIAEYVGYDGVAIDLWDNGLQKDAMQFFEEWKLPDCGSLNEAMLKKLATNVNLHYSRPSHGVGLDSEMKGLRRESPARIVKTSTKDTGSIVEPQANTSTGFHPELGESEVALIKACEKLDKDKMKHLVIWNSANPNVWSQELIQPIHIVTERGCVESVKFLQSRGADINSQRKTDGKTPLMIAATKGMTELAKVILELGGDVNIRDKYGAGCLHDKDVLENHALVSFICRKPGVDINLPTNNGNLSPLVMACMINSDRALQTVETLVSYNADLNGNNEADVTPLGVAATDGNIPLVEQLLEWDAQINRQDKTGRTALLRACTLDRMEMVTYLLKECQADPNIPDNDGDTPVMASVSVGNEDMLKLLLTFKPNVNIPRRLCDSSGIVLDFITPLCFAASKRSMSIVKMLVEAKADVNYISNEGYPYSPLVHSIYANSIEIFNYFKNLNQLDKSIGKLSMAIRVAVKFRREEMTKELIRLLGGYTVLVEMCKTNPEHATLSTCLQNLLPILKRSSEKPIERLPTDIPPSNLDMESLEHEADEEALSSAKVCDEFVDIVMSMVKDQMEPEKVIELAQELPDGGQIVAFLNYYFNERCSETEEALFLFHHFCGLGSIDEVTVMSVMKAKSVQSPATFIFGNPQLFSGATFKAKLVEIGQPQFVERFQHSLFTLKADGGHSFMSANLIFTFNFGPRFSRELKHVGLIVIEDEAAFEKPPDPFTFGAPLPSSTTQAEEPRTGNRSTSFVNNLDTDVAVTTVASAGGKCGCGCIMLAQRVEDLEQKLKEQQEMIDKLFCLYYQKMD